LAVVEQMTAIIRDICLRCAKVFWHACKPAGMVRLALNLVASSGHSPTSGFTRSIQAQPTSS
jgi:hypothetical protein